MTTDTKQLRELAKAATPGTWGFGFYEQCTPATNHEPIAYWVAGWGPQRYDYDKSTYIKHNDARFIQAANPTTVLELLDTIEKQRALLERAKTAQQSMIDHMCFGRFEPEQPDDGWRPKSQALYDSVDEITQHMKETP